MLTSLKSLSLAAVMVGALGLALVPTVSNAATTGQQTHAQTKTPQGNACGKYKDGTKAHDDCVKRQAAAAAKPATPAKKS